MFHNDLGAELPDTLKTNNPDAAGLFPGAGTSVIGGVVPTKGAVTASLLICETLASVLIHWWAVQGSNLRPPD